MITKSWHIQHRRSKQSPQNRHAQSFGVRVGYWPCLKAPFVSLDIASHRWDIWHGLPSYVAEKRHIDRLPAKPPLRNIKGGNPYVPPTAPTVDPQARGGMIVQNIHVDPPRLLADFDSKLVAELERRRSLGI